MSEEGPPLPALLGGRLEFGGEAVQPDLEKDDRRNPTSTDRFPGYWVLSVGHLQNRTDASRGSILAGVREGQSAGRPLQLPLPSAGQRRKCSQLLVHPGGQRVAVGHHDLMAGRRRPDLSVPLQDGSRSKHLHHPRAACDGILVALARAEAHRHLAGHEEEFVRVG